VEWGSGNWHTGIETILRHWYTWRIRSSLVFLVLIENLKGEGMAVHISAATHDVSNSLIDIDIQTPSHPRQETVSVASFCAFAFHI
jgi:hypothetical protein